MRAEAGETGRIVIFCWSTISTLDVPSNGIFLNMTSPYLEELAEKTRATAEQTASPWQKIHPDEKHRWRVATAGAAIAGGELVLAFMRHGEKDADKIHEYLLRMYGAGEYDAFTGETGPHPDLPRERGKAISRTGNTA